MGIWVTVFTGLLIASIIDRVVGLGWGYSSRDAWGFALFVGGGAAFWLFAMLISKIVLRYVRMTYGPNPDDDTPSQSTSSTE